jgi:hypothetical protein
MILLHDPRGLGATIQAGKVGPAILATKATAPSVVEQIQLTAEGSGGLTRVGLDKMKGALTNGWEQRIHATQAELLTKYRDQMQFAKDLWPPVAGVNFAKKFCERAAKTGYIDLLYPIGTIVEFGVPFAPTDLGSDHQNTLKSTYTPNAEQRFMATWAIYAASQDSLARIFDKRLASVPDLYVDLVDPTRGIQKIVNASNMSVMDVLKFVPSGMNHPIFTDDAPGLWNPIPATPDEVNNPGGLKKYYARGGFLWDRRLFTDKRSVAHSNLKWGEGYALCGEGIPMMALGSASGEDEYGYDFYFNISPTTFTLRVAATDADWYAEAGAAIVSALKRLGGLFCSAREQIKQISGDMLLADLCKDSATKKACVKGAPNCVCTPPLDSTKLAVGVANQVAERICNPSTSSKRSPFVPPPEPPVQVPSPPKPPDMIVGLTKGQMFALAFAGLGTGLLLAKRSSR